MCLGPYGGLNSLSLHKFYLRDVVVLFFTLVTSGRFCYSGYKWFLSRLQVYKDLLLDSFINVESHHGNSIFRSSFPMCH